jgi:hypothetical protein
VYPGATAGGLAQATPLALPTNWRVNLVIGGTTPSFTLCVGYDYHQ